MHSLVTPVDTLTIVMAAIVHNLDMETLHFKIAQSEKKNRSSCTLGHGVEATKI